MGFFYWTSGLLCGSVQGLLTNNRIKNSVLSFSIWSVNEGKGDVLKYKNVINCTLTHERSKV